MNTQQVDQLTAAWRLAHDTLAEQQVDGSHWTGELSTSALSTATAISALSQFALATAAKRRPGPTSESESRQKTEPASDASKNVAWLRWSEIDQAVRQAYAWLGRQQNADGGFGDTDLSHSNIATTLLVLAAWQLAEKFVRESAADGPDLPDSGPAKKAAREYVQRQGGWDGLRRRYGRDKTFVVPILSNCALAGLVPWSEVPPLPFELAWLPQDLYRWARMPVVSYAVPALVAIGQARFHFAPPKNPLLKALRGQAIAPTLRVLRSMQPASGGYLEATPLTSFVLMSLSAAGQSHLPVAQDCLRFILDARLEDGSWPIDTNLATWLTSLSVHALARRGKKIRLPSLATSDGRLADGEPAQLVNAKTVRWLLSCQHNRRHPFTGANPGGWGWTDLSGAVPDADDTPAALLALASIEFTPEYERLRNQSLVAVGSGVKWLLRLQNRDGGWPTFCRGWGRLPFDRSGTDLTAHALRALHAWLPRWAEIQHETDGLPSPSRVAAAMQRGLTYLEKTQQADGSWLPLWFGNQDRIDEDNPIYGTGKVLLAYGDLGLGNHAAAVRGVEYLRQNQNPDGGWGGGASVHYADMQTPMESSQKEASQDHLSHVSTGKTSSRWSGSSTVEETAVAVEGWLAVVQGSVKPGKSGGMELELAGSGHGGCNASIMHALDWLAHAAQSGCLHRSRPIGFYFAKLWYYERLYPAIFSMSALGAALDLAEAQSATELKSC